MYRFVRAPHVRRPASDDKDEEGSAAGDGGKDGEDGKDGDADDDSADNAALADVEAPTEPASSAVVQAEVEDGAVATDDAGNVYYDADGNGYEDTTAEDEAEIREGMGLGSEWYRVWSDDSYLWYWYNEQTQQSVWEDAMVAALEKRRAKLIGNGTTATTDAAATTGAVDGSDGDTGAAAVAAEDDTGDDQPPLRSDAGEDAVDAASNTEQ